MATFAYVGKTRLGALKKGEVVAKTREEAIEQLRKINIGVTNLQEKALSQGLLGKFGKGGSVKDKDLVVFTRQFSTMINAGLPLVQCLDILSTQSENKFLGKAVGEIKLDVEGGSTFADALKRHPKVFDDLYVNMVHAGEVGGLLDTILLRLAKHIEKAMKLKSAIKSAMVYPSAIIGVSILMVWVIPIFAKMFTEMSGGKVGLPGPTQFVIGLSEFMQSYIIFIIAALAGIAYGIKRYYGTANGRVVIDRLLLKAPIVGELIRKASVAKFTRTLGTLITSGVPIMD